jgi:hypothetical protein
MKYLFLLLLLSCSSQTRILSKAEMDSMGLHGVIYDAQICDSKFDPKSKKHITTRSCEWVTCERQKGEIVCTARKNPNAIE